MSPLLPWTLSLLLFATAAPEAPQAPVTPERVLRVCADPNNLPFSNAREEGFENRLAQLLARELKARVEYTWWAQRRGFLRSTLKAGLCDVVMGVPGDLEMVLATRPYYRSTYVFVSRKDGGPQVHSFDDPALRTLKVGVHLVGDDFSNTPPAHALTRRGIIQNVVGFTLYGDYAEDSPPSALVEAVRRGDVDVAVVWGPLAGYHARRDGVPLTLSPVRPRVDPPGLAFAFDIAVGVRRGDTALREELDAALKRRRREVRALLAEYGVPSP